MKVYIDSKDYVITYCAFTGRESLETKNTPIVVESIAEHDKQIRKEVVQEIREFIHSKEYDNFGIEYLMNGSAVLEKLDRIEGEENGKIH